MPDALRVTAHLCSPLAGEPPHLDSLLVYVSSRLSGKDAEPGFKIDRNTPCPDSSKIAIPMLRINAAGWGIAACTSPIMSEPLNDCHEHVAKRIGVEHSLLLAEDERRVVTTTNSWTKSYRLPLRVRRVEKVVWLCIGNRREILSSLKLVPAIGKKISIGYGRVARWEIERLDYEPLRWWPWFIDGVLMRPLPLAWGKLPQNLQGAKRDYCSVVDPYWHPDRYTEAVVPC